MAAEILPDPSVSSPMPFQATPEMLGAFERIGHAQAAVHQLIAAFNQDATQRLADASKEAQDLWAQIFAAAGVERAEFNGELDRTTGEVTFSPKDDGTLDLPVPPANLGEILAQLAVPQAA